MIDNRFDHDLLPGSESAPPSGFLLVPIATTEAAPASPLQSLYQQMYEQAVRANQQPATRDLFAIMN